MMPDGASGRQDRNCRLKVTDEQAQVIVEMRGRGEKVARIARVMGLSRVEVPCRDVGEFIFCLTIYIIPLFCIGNVILCIIALHSIKQSKGELKGKGLAILGPTISIGHIVFFILRPYGGPAKKLQYGDILETRISQEIIGF